MDWMIAILKFLKKILLKFSDFYFFCEILKPNNYNNKKKALAKQVKSSFFLGKKIQRRHI
jgi:hypothetical protein